MMQEAWLEGPKYKVFLHYNRIIFLSLLGLPVCVVGRVTSGLSICMFLQDKTTPRTTRMLLIVLSLTDVHYLLFSLIIFQPMTFCDYDPPLRGPLLTRIIGVLANVLEYFRNWVVELISVERFVVICLPIRSKVWCNERLTTRMIAAYFVFSHLVQLPIICYLVIEDAGLPVISCAVIEKAMPA
ncbi:unnamed protein product [Dibothriocephalus latus]|uniref:G-protein coupled receptors family 1 profile domain-containing protein n=1 Tax=Dibothriocephalus latus TaxID=60516 RepID=A0A3P7NCJ8_DIBLA|nr:unnamed protein product [Dibothriocephalus latus]